MLEMAFLGIPLLVGKATNLLQDGKMVADSIYRIAFFFRGESLIVVNELLRQLPESQVLDLIPVSDELAECKTHIVIAGISPFRTVNTDTGFEVVTDNVRHFHERHLRFHAALKIILHIGGVKTDLTGYKAVECGVYRQQQFFNPGIGFHRFLALAVQTAFTRVPEFRCAGQLTSELRHCAVHRDSSHHRGFTRLVQPALFEVEQHLEFFYFHTLIFFSAKLLAV